MLNPNPKRTKRLMHHRLVFLLLLCTAAKSLCAQSPDSTQLLREIKDVETSVCGSLLINDEQPGTIQERMAKYNAKGLSIAVIHNYKLRWAKAYGWADEESKTPLTTKTLFEPGSISKSLNAVGILKLAQDKKVDLHADINRYLVSWKFPYDSVSKGKPITLADILSHRAGLSVHGFPGHSLSGPIPTVYQVLDGTPPSFTPAVCSMVEPGLGYEYSGGGTTISQVLLSDVCKQSYDQWMAKNVLEPLGMRHSTFAQPPPQALWSQCASGYRRDGTRIDQRFHMYPEQAAAGLWMTPSDLCAYIIDMQKAHQKKKASAVLKPEMLRLHLSIYKDGPTSLGSFIEDHDGALYFEHGAANDGFCGEYVASLESGDGVVVFMNTENPKLISEVINSVARCYKWKNYYREPQRRSTVVVPDSVLSDYEGIYLYDQSWAAIAKKDSSYQYYVNGDYAKMYFSSSTCFFNVEHAAIKDFVRDDRGVVVGYDRKVGERSLARSTKIGTADTLHAGSNIFAEIGWYYFEAKKYKESISFLKRGADLYPNDIELLMNLAVVKLYNGNTAEAMSIFKAHRKQMQSPGNSWENMLSNYIKYFKENSYDVSVFDPVLKELELEKP